MQEQPTMTVAPLEPGGGEQFAGFVQRVLTQMGLAAELAGVGYGTEASSFGPAAVPAIVLGPGDIAQAHTRDEWIDLEQLHRGVEVYLGLMSTPL